MPAYRTAQPRVSPTLVLSTDKNGEFPAMRCKVTLLIFPPVNSYCDNALRNGASTTLLSEKKCGTSCSALSTENCGGASTLSLYVNPNIVLAQKQSTISPGYVQVGCVADAPTSRALTGASFTSSSMSGGACTAFCASKGMPLAGVEYGSEW